MSRTFFIAILLCATSVVVGSVIPRPAYALFGAGDTVVVVGDIPRFTKDWGLDVAAWFGGNAMIQAMTTSFLNQLLMGSSGGAVPPIVGNMRTALLQTGDRQVQLFMSQLRSGWAIDSPFRNVVLDAVEREDFLSSGPGGFTAFSQFTLPQFTNDPRRCLEGRIDQVGLNCLFGLAKNQANDPIGAKMALEDAVSGERKGAENELKRVVDQGKGFLGNLECADTGTVTAGPVALSGGLPSLLNCVTRTPGSTVAELTNAMLPAGLQRVIQADEISETIASLVGQMLAQTIAPQGLFGMLQPSSGGGRSFLDQTTADVAQQGNTTVGGAFLSIADTQRGAIEEYQTAWQKIYVAAVDVRTQLETCGKLNTTSDGAFVRETITEAQEALARAQTAQTALNELEREAEAAVSGESASNVSISSLYQGSVAIIPTPTEVQDALTESSEEAGSTYSRLQQLSTTPCALIL